MIKNLKTKKSLRVLATKKVTAVALYNFRSLEEIDEYIKNIKNEFSEDTKRFESVKKVLAFAHAVTAAITIKKLNTKNAKPNTTEFVKPNMEKLQKAFSVVDKYQDKLDALDSVINTLQLEFKGEKGAPNTLKELKTFRTTVKTKLDAAYKFLSDLANNHEPEGFKKVVKAVYDKAVKVFSKAFESTKQIIYMIPQDENTILISHYIEFKNFVDHNEYVHEKYYLVISTLINTENGNTSYFVNSLQNYATPTKAGKGIKVDSPEEAAVQALISLEHAGFISLSDRTVIPTDQNKLDRINWNAPKDWIKAVSINEDNDMVSVDFTKAVNEANVQDAINHFIIDLKTSIIPNNYRMGIKTKKYKTGKLYSVDYVFTLPDAHQRKEIKLDATKVRQLKEMFGMSDKQAGDLIKHFNSI